jgi:O-antigen ligase
MASGSSFVARRTTIVAVTAAAVVVALLALLTAVRPAIAAGSALLVALAVIAATQRLAGPRVLAAAAGAVALALLTAAGALLVSVWPATVLLAAIVVGVLVLAWRRPALGLGAAVALFGFEGSAKILLGLESTPLPGGNRAVGAAALDLALFGAVAVVLVKDRLRTPRAIWTSASRIERAVIGTALAWLALSIVQIAQGGHLSRGFQGFRLFQAYTLVALATLVVFSRPRLRASATSGALAIGLVVSLYAAVRVVLGPADAEQVFALSISTVTMYGGAFRAVGSFSSAIGLSSFLTPVAVFALVVGFLAPSRRALAWTVAVLAVVGLIGSYSRSSLFGVALGVVAGLALVLLAGSMPARRKLVAAGLVVALLAATYGGVLLASRASPQLRERAQGMLHPFSDESVRLRLKTWRNRLDEVAARPLGQGVGAVGAASSPDRAVIKTTDNSFLKVLVEQGVIGFALFACGVLGIVVAVARRLRNAAGDSRSLGLAALAGFVAFLGTAATGEAVEQPGKVVAWGLLGVAAAQAWPIARGTGETSGSAPA